MYNLILNKINVWSFIKSLYYLIFSFCCNCPHWQGSSDWQMFVTPTNNPLMKSPAFYVHTITKTRISATTCICYSVPSIQGLQCTCCSRHAVYLLFKYICSAICTISQFPQTFNLSREDNPSSGKHHSGPGEWTREQKKQTLHSYNTRLNLSKVSRSFG